VNKVTALLSKRLKRADKSSKTAALARESAEGRLTGFAGVFSVSELSTTQKEGLAQILREHNTDEHDISDDLQNLSSITAEVQAINNQAAILHGERIKKAQTILKQYRDGAFTAWLTTTYGNRQTPYNLLQYFEFYHEMPTSLRPQIESMPRQAIYTLASREGAPEAKQDIIKNYQGETKNELLAMIRDSFPLDEGDRRRANPGENAIKLLKQLYSLVNDKRCSLTQDQHQTIATMLENLASQVSDCSVKK